MDDFRNLVTVRPADPGTGYQVDQFDWVWLTKDTGAWDGPRTDWEHHHLNTYFNKVKNFDVCVQAGGCLGMYPKLLAAKFRHVYTFEPDPLSFYCLVNNLRIENVSAFNAALGDCCRTIRVNRSCEDNVGMNTVVPDGGAYTLQLSIDSLNLRACDLICLDIESYEIHALRGAKGTIERFRPVVAAERPSDEIRQFMTNLGYLDPVMSMSDGVFVPK